MVQVAPCLRAGQASISAAIAGQLLHFSSLRSSIVECVDTSRRFLSKAARLRQGRNAEVSRPGLQLGRVRTRRHRADPCPHASRQASALFRLRTSGRPDSGIDSPALPPLHSASAKDEASSRCIRSAGCKLSRQSRTARSLPNKGRCGTHRPRDFVRPRQQHYGRDAPHVAQDTDIAVSTTSFVSLRSQTGRPH